MTAHPKRHLIFNLDDAGVGRNEIARQLRVSTHTVSECLKERGVQATRQETPAGDEGWWRQGSIKANIGWREGFEAEAKAGSWYAKKVLTEAAA